MIRRFIGDQPRGRRRYFLRTVRLFSLSVVPVSNDIYDNVRQTEYRRKLDASVQLDDFDDLFVREKYDLVILTYFVATRNGADTSST